MDLLTNILCYFNTWISIRLSGFPMGISILTVLERYIPGSILISKAGINFFLHMQFCSAISLSIHRITSVVFFTRHDQLWLRWYVPLGLVYSAYSVLLVLYVGQGATYFVDENGVLMRTNNVGVVESGLSFSSKCTILYFFLLLGVGLSTARLVSRKVQAVNIPDHGIGKKLTKMALVYCGIFTGILLYTVLFSFSATLISLPESVFIYSYNIMAFASDMMTLALPYILLIFDNNVRRDFMFLHKKRKIGSSTFVSASVVRR
uniref:Serpentine receptor class gamma n=1 Tax=Caenorhabditis japonica TaxID=281687 RepID=A0A8R1HTQ2_CAEJA